MCVPCRCCFGSCSCMMSVAAFRLHVTSCALACLAAVSALLAAVSARVACVSVSQQFWLPAAAVSAHCNLFGSMPALSCSLQPFRLACPCSALFRLVLPCCLGLEGSVLLHVMSLDLVTVTCSSGRSLCVLLARHVLEL